MVLKYSLVLFQLRSIKWVVGWPLNSSRAFRGYVAMAYLTAPRGGTKEIPKGPSTQYLRTLVPKTIPSRVFGTRVLQYWVFGPSGYAMVKIPYVTQQPFSKPIEDHLRTSQAKRN